jgi:hypothetical protein
MRIHGSLDGSGTTRRESRRKELTVNRPSLGGTALFRNKATLMALLFCCSVVMWRSVVAL